MPSPAALAVGAVGERGVGAAGQQAHRVVVRRRRRARGEPERPGSTGSSGVGSTHPAAEPGGVGVLDDGGDGDRAAGLEVGGEVLELGEGLARDLLDVDVEDAAAGQADRERVVVGDAVALQHRGAGRRRPPGRARRRRPRRSRPTPSRPRSRRGRPASRRPAGAARTGTSRPRCRRRPRRRRATTAAAPGAPHARAPHASASTSTSSAYVASECPATKSSQ